MQKLSINFRIPESWAELSDKQLRKVYELVASDMSTDEIKILCLLRWTDSKVVGRQPDGSYLLKKGDAFFEVTPVMLAEILPSIDWIEQISPTPVRLAHLNRRRALPADFQEVRFETFIICDNLFQGYLATHQEELLNNLGNVLYQCDGKSFNTWSRISIFYWMASLKEFFARRFPTFFQPAQEAEKDSGNLLGGPGKVTLGSHLQEATDSMIRALTKGDVTKEAQILALDTWRALTELEALAKDYQSVNQQVNGN